MSENRTETRVARRLKVDLNIQYVHALRLFREVMQEGLLTTPPWQPARYEALIEIVKKKIEGAGSGRAENSNRQHRGQR